MYQSYCVNMVQMKGLAPLRYHAGVAIDGCPSFVADKQQKSALVSAIPTRSSPLLSGVYKKMAYAKLT